MGARLLVYPRFENADALSDRYWRYMHYLAPAAEGVDELRFLAPAPPAAPPPDYLDPDLPARARLLGDKVTFSAEGERERWDAVIVWDAARADDRAIAGARRVILDPAALHEGDLGVELGAELRPSTPVERAESQKRLLERIAASRGPRVHVFGTGPSLASVDVAALAPGVSIVCNSLVKDAALLERLRPDFIVAVDPIFHAGPSRHAGVFRAHLITALERLRPLFVVQERDAHIYRAILPDHVRDLLTSIPVAYATAPNLDLEARFALTATRNVLTMAMLPLAAMLGEEEVRIYGCDGRAPGEAAAFWSYDPRTAFEGEARLQYAAHPGFFTLDFKDYYALHCETVRRWIRAMDRRGLSVVSATPSFIPALRARGAQSGDALPGALGLAARGRAAYAYRALQSRYGALLNDARTPLWVKHALRGAVVGARRVLGVV